VSDLLERARQNEQERGSEWGYRVTLETGEHFEGRWRGETIATGGDYGDQRLFLLWDRDGQECYVRGYAALARKVDDETPGLGASVVIVRGDDYQSAGGTGYSFGIASEPNDAPLPEADVQTSLGDDDPDW
jgi:hypothetical protein